MFAACSLAAHLPSGGLLSVAQVQCKGALVWRGVMAQVAGLAIEQQLAGPAAAAPTLHSASVMVAPENEWAEWKQGPACSMGCPLQQLHC